MKRTLVIVGLGLIGGSLALALKGFEDFEIVGVDVSQPTLRYAAEHGVGDRVTEQAADVVPQADVVMMPYHTGFDEAGRVVYTFDRERIVRNSPRYRWQGRIHEVIVPAGRIVLWEAAVTHKKLRVHDPDRNLRIFEAMRAAGEEFSARDQYYYGRELMFHHRIEEAKQVLEAFLSRPEGWVENKISACQDLARCHRPDVTEGFQGLIQLPGDARRKEDPDHA